MTDEEIRGIIDSGVDRYEIEYIMMHDELDEEIQDELMGYLAVGDLNSYDFLMEKLVNSKFWDAEKDGPGDLTPEEEAKVNAAIDYIMDLEGKPREIIPQMQYLNLSYIMRHLFYNENEILSVVAPDLENTIRFQTDAGECWDVTYGTHSYLEIDKRLDCFDFAVLDAIFTLYTNGICFFSTSWIDAILTGSKKRASTKDGLKRIDQSIEKLSYLEVQLTIDGERRNRTPLLSMQKFGNTEGCYYYLEEMNDLYNYASEMQQIANVPSTYFDTSTLPEKYKFNDTETAIYIKRRVIARVMGILRQSKQKHHRRQHWNRISLIQAKEKKYYDPKGRQKAKTINLEDYPRTKKRGLFAELGLMPDVDGIDPEEQKAINSKWRKTKADYMRVVKGTLEHLKQIHVILDYEECRPNESKSRREPVIGYDIICFNKTEADALAGMRDEQKAAYVQRLLDKRNTDQS